MKKKILHIFPESLFIDGYLQMLEKDKNNHQFILTNIGGNIDFDINKYSQYKFDKVSTFKLTDFIKLRKMLKEYDYDLLIIHSGYLNFLLLSFLLNKKVLSKTILSLWGGSDSRKFVADGKNKKYYLLGVIYNKLRKNLYSSVKGIASIVEDDYKSVKELYNLTCPNYISTYPFIPNIQNSFREKDNETYNIQVCHSGSIDCNTLEVLEKLKKYKKENIKVYASLAYGNEEYIKEILDKGKKIFGEKFIPKLEIENAQDYAKYISNLNIIINNSIVQQGLGNLNLAFSSGVKVYLNKDGKDQEFYKNMDLTFYNLDDIGKVDLQELLRISDEVKNKNHKNISSQFDIKYALDLWNNIFKA